MQFLQSHCVNNNTRRPKWHLLFFNSLCCFVLMNLYMYICVKHISVPQNNGNIKKKTKKKKMVTKRQNRKWQMIMRRSGRKKRKNKLAAQTGCILRKLQLFRRITNTRCYTNYLFILLKALQRQ